MQDVAKDTEIGGLSTPDEVQAAHGVARERRREVLSESRMREICMSGSMSGCGKGYGQATKAPPDERGGKQPNVTAPHFKGCYLHQKSFAQGASRRGGWAGGPKNDRAKKTTPRLFHTLQRLGSFTNHQRSAAPHTREKKGTKRILPIFLSIFTPPYSYPYAKLHFTGTQIWNPPAPFHASKFSLYRSSRWGMSAAASPAAGSARAKTA